MYRTFTISVLEEQGSLESFPLLVPAADTPSNELVDCVKNRLAIQQGARFYFTYEPEPNSRASNDVVPLCSTLPEGCKLRLVLLPPTRPVIGNPGTSGGTSLQPIPSTRIESVGDPGGVVGQCVFEQNALPSDKEIATDLANERTVLAWMRTALAVIRTVFSFATLKGLTKPTLVADALITITLSVSAVATLLVGWQRFATIRSKGVLHARRINIKPLVAVFVAISAVCCAGVLTQAPRKLSSPSGRYDEYDTHADFLFE
eukprot:TRINITY_DN33226_c0_g1_i1.p1 TRINITY_DN33226_c0_g1~~TRINITY_DN33226_c0_g1_i1.p1  ORF type:complete len:260 (-),score=16.75 TRINITY_DN33226_c0_g1_i1:68-847(-)